MRQGFGSQYYGFEGTIDFGGHSLSRSSIYDTHPLFYSISKAGVIKNLVLNIYLNNEKGASGFQGLFYKNYGTISNIIINLKQCNELDNKKFSLLGDTNSGLIEKFIVNFEVTFYGAADLYGLYRYNYGGICRNGYAYGNDILAIFPIDTTEIRGCSPLIYQLDTGMIENVYSLVHVTAVEQVGRTEKVGAVLSRNYGTVRNLYSVGESNSTNIDYKTGPTVGLNTGEAKNVMYFCDTIYNNAYNIKSTKLALYDTKFQNQMLNDGNAFEVDSLIELGYYPQLKLSDKMPAQDFIPLPEVYDRDLVDIVSYEVIEDDSEKIKVELIINNPAGEEITDIRVKDISSRIISQVYENSKTTLIMELSYPLRYVSQYSIMSITSRGAFDLPFTREYEAGEKNIYVSMYRKVSSIDDWCQINESPTENYRLIEDLDFLGCGNEIIIRNEYTGIIDGNNHTIKNIKLLPDSNNYGLIHKLSGELKNLYVENFSKENPTTCDALAFISHANSNEAKIDNVHIKNARLYCDIANGKVNIGGIIADCTKCTIVNSSVTNLSIEFGTQQNTIAIGGIVGQAKGARISNCFVQDINIIAKRALIYNGIGGILGYDAGSYTQIKNCYTTGKIDTDAIRVGGIYGYATDEIDNCYSTVNIRSESDYIGGIGGFDSYDNIDSTTKNLYLGNLYCDKQSENINRIIGNTNIEVGNYAYARQKINGFESEDKMGAEKLLTYDEVFNLDTYKVLLGYENIYNYDGLSNHILPKLYDTDGKNILPNQKDNKLSSPEIYIEEVELFKEVYSAKVRIVINNPQNVPITGIEVEYANIEITRNVFDNGKTYIDFELTPERAYDSYIINRIVYEEDGDIQYLDAMVKLNAQFYNDINSFDDWQRIDTESAQNYRLNVDIDYAGMPAPRTNLSIGRLEGSGDGHTIRNIDITISGEKKAFIKEIKNSFTNISFENITISNTSNKGEYTGLILRNTAITENISFKHITINARKMSYVGMICNNASPYVNTVKLEDITVSGADYVSGFLALTDSTDIQYVDLDTANITATGNYSGGIAAFITTSSEYRVRDFTGTNITIQGNKNVGGLVGDGRTVYSIITDSYISGAENVGGIAGTLRTSVDCRELECRNCTILGTKINIGGITGTTGQYSYIRDSYCIGVTVIGEGVNCECVGGFLGFNRSSIQRVGVIGSTIRSDGKSVGGIFGKSSGSLDWGFVYNSNVTGDRDVGGIIGEQRDSTIADSYFNGTVTATTSGAGGIVGFMDNTDMTDTNHRSILRWILTLDAKISAPTQVGGVIGRCAERLFSTEYFRKYYVDAELTCESDEVSLGVGSDKSQNNRIEGFYAYEKCKINGVEVDSSNIDNIPEGSLKMVADLYSKATWTEMGFDNQTKFNINNVTKGIYPTVRNYSTVPLYQESIYFPDIRNREGGLDLEKEEKSEILPDVILYAVDVNKVNIEFKSIPEDLKLYYKIQDEEKEYVLDVKQKVYTFEYDYNCKVNLTVNNGEKSMYKTLKPEDVRNTISQIDGTTYYLKDGNLYQEDEKLLVEEFTNLYEECSLGKDGTIYNIEEQSFGDYVTEKFALLDETVSLASSVYNGIRIETYGTFSILRTEKQTVAKEGKIFVRNNLLSLIDSTIDTQNNEIIDQYNGKEYETVLGEDGKLYDLKTPLAYPENFSNKNIEEIAADLSDNPYIAVKYEDGKVTTFNYVTGEEKYNNGVKEEISLLDYMKEAFSLEGLKENIVESSNEKYLESEILRGRLEETPIETVLEQVALLDSNNEEIIKDVTDNLSITESESSYSKIDIAERNSSSKKSTGSHNNGKANTSNNESYITSYDNKSEQYLVYKVSEILDLEKDDYESETTKIAENAKLKEYYGAKKEEIKETNGLNWIIATIIAIIISLRILIVRNRVIRKRKRK